MNGAYYPKRNQRTIARLCDLCVCPRAEERKFGVLILVLLGGQGLCNASPYFLVED